jgi:two-component system, response regulator YesN
MKPIRVLIAEDDVELRNWLRLVFRPLLQVEVLAAKNGAELLLSLSDGSPIDVVITDIRMPQGSGLEMVVEARKLGQSVPVIFITGYSDAAVEKIVMELDHAVLLRKPVDEVDLLEWVHQFLMEEKRPLFDITPIFEPTNGPGKN